MTKHFINIENKTINQDIQNQENERQLPQAMLILDGYKSTKRSESLLLGQKYLPFNERGTAIQIDDSNSLTQHKTRKKKKIALLSTLVAFSSVFIATLIMEINLQFFIRHKENTSALYLGICLLLIFLIYTIAKIILNLINMKLENKVIEKHLRYNTKENFYAKMRKDKDSSVTSKLAAVFVKNEAQIHRTIGMSQISPGYKIKRDIQYLYILYDEFNLAIKNNHQKNLPLKGNFLKDYISFFIEENYLTEESKAICRNILNKWRNLEDKSDQINFRGPKNASANLNAATYNIELIKQIIYRIFENINCYYQYDSLVEFLKDKISGVNSNLELRESELYKMKRDEFKTKE